MICEESSRYGGSATSKFIEVQGGGLWRANFYLKKTGDVRKTEEEAEFHDLTEYKKYNREWLDTQNANVEWVYPSPDRTPSIPSVNIGIKHGPDHKVALSLNGMPVSVHNLESRVTDSSRNAILSRWRGVDIQDGQNTFVATVTDQQGNVVTTLRREVHYVKNIQRANTVPDQSVLIADGRTPPVLAIRLEDSAGRPVHAGRIAKIDIPAPYRLLNENRLEGGKRTCCSSISPNRCNCRSWGPGQN